MYYSTSHRNIHTIYTVCETDRHPAHTSYTAQFATTHSSPDRLSPLRHFLYSPTCYNTLQHTVHQTYHHHSHTSNTDQHTTIHYSTQFTRQTRHHSHTSYTEQHTTIHSLQHTVHQTGRHHSHTSYTEEHTTIHYSTEFTT